MNLQSSMLYLCRYGELWLKSEPVRRRFVKILIENLKNQLSSHKITGFRISATRERLFIESSGDMAKIIKKTFGLTSFSVVEKCQLDEVGPKVVKISKKWKKNDTFAIRVKRSGTHDFTSKDKEREWGALVPNKANLSNPDKTIFVEIRDSDCYVFSEVLQTAGGLPVGCEGSVVVEFDGSIKSNVSAYLMMKRGCHVFLVGKGASDNVKNAKKLLEYDQRIKVYKRFRDFPSEAKPLAIVSSSVGNFHPYLEINNTQLPFFYPLVGLGKKKISEIYKKM